MNIFQCFKKYIALSVIFVFNCFPIKKNKVLFYSYYGSQYGCNPKYITEYIIDKYHEGKFDLVWAFCNVKLKEHLKGFRKVKFMSLKYFYELCTSRIIITNFRTTDLFVKRKGQYYIQTWHSSLRLKYIEKDASGFLPGDYIKMAKKDSLKCDLLLSGCEYSTRIFKKAFWYNGAIFEHGTPRNDILFRNDLSVRDKIKKTFNIPQDYKIVLYAPTFRKNDCMDVYNLDYHRVLEKLRDRFGSNWIFLVRLHPHLIAKAGQLVYGNNVVDATSYDDTGELLSTSDVLITDYSSVMFDFSLTHRPCFMYVPDVKDYINNERKLYFDIDKLPFISAASNEELLDKITFFDNKAYEYNLINFMRMIGTFEKGNACEKLARHIYEICFGKIRGDWAEEL